MDILTILLLAALGLSVGLCIGCVGIGGVILVPALTYLGGIEIQIAIAAAMMGYLLTGAAGAAIYARRRSIQWPMALWLCAGAMPAALAGAWISNNVPAAVLEITIALLTVSAGIHALLGGKEQAAQGPTLSRPSLVAIGIVTGFASAITGTGGPLVLVPVLLWLKFPVLTAIGLSQAVQFPIAALATLGNFLYGQLDLLLGAVLAISLAGGTILGAYVAHVMPRALLCRIVASVLILVGTSIVARLLFALARSTG